MPIYKYYCQNCGAEFEIIHSIAECDQPIQCNLCQFLLKRQICPPMLQMDYPGYTCPITGKYIDGKRAHRENLVRHNCRVFEPGEKEAYLRRVQKTDLELDKKVEETTAKLITNMSHEKRCNLQQAMDNNLNINIMRG